MRIIAGRFKGLRLPSPRSRGLRPTTDRAREAIFSAIGPLVEGSRVLDLFAGTGAFGLESLSRGAEKVVFVEKDRKAVLNIAETVEVLGLEREALVMCTAASRALEKLAALRATFRIVFFDPPYADEAARKLILNGSLPCFVEEGGILVVERGSRTPGYEVPPDLLKYFERRYGDTTVEIFRKQTKRQSKELL